MFNYPYATREPHGVDSSGVNDCLREASGGEFTAKDFRNWHGSAAALGGDEKAARGKTLANRLVSQVAQVAQRLGNTATVCRTSYSTGR